MTRYDGPERRVCVFHEGTCEDIKRLESTTLPRWVFLWIGGPVVSMLLVFSAWTAVRSIDLSERLVKVEFKTEAMLNNQEKLMEFFNIKPDPKAAPVK